MVILLGLRRSEILGTQMDYTIHLVDDLYHKLDRPASEGLPQGHEDARCDAECAE